MAYVKITALTGATAPDVDDVLELVEDGTSVKATTLQILTGAMSVQKPQSFTIRVKNSAGTIQHAICASSAANGVDGIYADKVSGATKTLNNTPALDTVTGFTAGAGILAADTSTIIFDTIDQTPANLFGMLTVEYYNGNILQPQEGTIRFASRNINGVTQNRLELSMYSALTGTSWSFNTTNLPSGTEIDLHLLVFLA